MSLDNTTPATQPTKDETQASVAGADGRKVSTLKPPEQTLNCPRCDSPNTKFCYYNNYSLTQPRHFCKTCRRYWTKGGALRNVPIGGGCRKTKKTTRSASSQRFFNGDSSNKDSSLDIGGLSLFTGLSPPAMDFQFPSSTSNNPPPYMSLDHPLGFNFPLVKQNHHHQLHGGSGLASFQELGITNNLASSIESLSSMNQDLHLKLQQQRLVSLLGNRGGQEIDEQNQIGTDQSQQPQKLQPILFHNLEVLRPLQATMGSDHLRKVGDGNGGGGGGLETEWFFEDNYARVNANPADSNIAGNYENGTTINNWNNNNNNGIHGWNIEFNDQYTALP